LKDFKNIVQYDYVIKQCIDKDACHNELSLLKNSTSAKEFYSVLISNLKWVLYKEIDIDWDNFVRYGDVELLNGYDWSFLLRYFPELAEHCNFDNFFGSDWSRLICKQSQFMSKCDKEKLNCDDWSYIVVYHPQFINICDCDKFYGFNWSYILVSQPTLGKYCNWNTLNGHDWDYLLSVQSQFEKYREKNNE
jgi:hypothetical protein